MIPQAESKPMIHPTAIISEKARIGTDVRIGPHCWIGDNVSIGDGCILEKSVSVFSNTAIGKGTSVRSYASVGTDPDTKFSTVQASEGRLEVGENCVIGCYTFISRGALSENQLTRIGDGVSIGELCYFGHDCLIGDRVEIHDSVVIENSVTIGTGTRLRYGTLVIPDSNIGESVDAQIRSRVSHDIPPFVKVSGDPAKIKGLSEVFLKQMQFSTTMITEMNEILTDYFSEPMPAEYNVLEKYFSSYPEFLGLIKFCHSNPNFQTDVFLKRYE